MYRLILSQILVQLILVQIGRILKKRPQNLKRVRAGGCARPPTAGALCAEDFYRRILLGPYKKNRAAL